MFQNFLFYSPNSPLQKRTESLHKAGVSWVSSPGRHHKVQWKLLRVKFKVGEFWLNKTITGQCCSVDSSRALSIQGRGNCLENRRVQVPFVQRQDLSCFWSCLVTGRLHWGRLWDSGMGPRVIWFRLKYLQGLLTLQYPVRMCLSVFQTCLYLLLEG